MNRGKRIKMTTNAVHLLAQYEWPELDYLLTQFNCPTRTVWDGDKESYCFAMMTEIQDQDLIELHAHLSGEEDGSVESEALPWQDNHFKLFLSHLVVHKDMLGEIKENLKSYGIDAFVAHDSIEPTREWMRVIEAALLSCDAGVAFLHEGFQASKWCDQEIGYMLARHVPVLPLIFESGPYGFLSKYQGIHCIKKNGQKLSAFEISQKIVQWLSTNSATQGALTNGLVTAFENSGSFARTRELWPLLADQTNFTPAHLRRLESAITKNSQISGAVYGTANVPDLVRKLIAEKTRTP